MSDVKMVILNSDEEQQRLENFLFTGIKDRGVKIFLSSIGFQLKSDPTKATLVNSDDLEKYLTINKIGGGDDHSGLSFDNVPYTLVVVDQDVSKQISVDFDKKNSTEVETFSFELVIDITNGQFHFHFPTINDPLGLFEDIAGASFSFIKTEIKG